MNENNIEETAMNKNNIEETTMSKNNEKSTKTLLLRFSSPLQSWGSGFHGNIRETDDYPTKSGAIGLLAAALGRKRNESIEDLAALKFGVRIDHKGVRLDDFQAQYAGEGVEPNFFHCIYLSDATFLVGFSSEDEDFLEEISDAIDHPKFSLYLGRKSCPPSGRLNLGIRDLDLYDALYGEPWSLPGWWQEKILRDEGEAELRIIMDADQGTLKKDVPISFSPYDRRYGYRYIKEMPPKVITRLPSEDKEEEEDLDKYKYMEHDAMKALG